MKLSTVQATHEYGCSLCPRPIKFAEMHYCERGIRTHKRCRLLVEALVHGQNKAEDGKAVG